MAFLSEILRQQQQLLHNEDLVAKIFEVVLSHNEESATRMLEVFFICPACRSQRITVTEPRPAQRSNGCHGCPGAMQDTMEMIHEIITAGNAILAKMAAEDAC